MKRIRTIIMGAAGRDFHNFNVCFRENPQFRVIAFTAAQIPYVANRRYPPSLSGKLYPRGIPIFPEGELEDLMYKHRIQHVVFSYSDISYQALMHIASRVLAHGADFSLIGPDATMLKSRRPVISVSAVRTGCGKSEVTRYLADILKAQGIKPIVIRHPMPYGNLTVQEVERFEQLEDLALHRCTIEEREEFEPLLQHNIVVYAGVDYEKIIRRAEREGDVIIWDGGNNDVPFIRANLEITVADPLRVGDEVAFYPGEVNLRRAAAVVINKCNTAPAASVEQLKKTIVAINPDAVVIKTASEISVADPAAVRGKNVLVIEDGPTITHGNMPSGAGLIAALQNGAAQVIDPRSYAVGSLADIYRTYPHIGPVLPAMGYRPEQVEELRQTVAAVPCDLVLIATPIDLSRITPIVHPVLHVRYDIAEEPHFPLKALMTRFIATACK